MELFEFLRLVREHEINKNYLDITQRYAPSVLVCGNEHIYCDGHGNYSSGNCSGDLNGREDLRVRKREFNLEKRVQPIYECLENLIYGNYKGDRFAVLLKPKDGLIDHFFRSEMLYILMLDKKHKKYKEWKAYIRIRGGQFTFTPRSNFMVHGKILERGQKNCFIYYFVDVSKYKNSSRIKHLS